MQNTYKLVLWSLKSAYFINHTSWIKQITKLTTVLLDDLVCLLLPLSVPLMGVRDKVIIAQGLCTLNLESGSDKH